jgi:3-dehydroquinate synthase
VIKLVELKINLGERSYPVFIGWDVLGELDKKWFLESSRTGIVSHLNLVNKWGKVLESRLRRKGTQVRFFPLPVGERSKSLRTCFRLYESLAREGFLRQDVLIAFGGGVVGDVAGFVAATYMRGIPLVQMPTTLLSQVDSSIGGKVGVNLPAGKNLVGSFYQPKAVFSDLSLLKDLPFDEVRSGLAEVIKTAFLSSVEFVNFLEENLDKVLKLDKKALLRAVKECVQYKGSVVERDERESGYRSILNYGHTVGHALEKIERFGSLRHGEAISIGLVVAAKISHKLGYLKKKWVDKHLTLLKAAGLPITLPHLSRRDFFQALVLDKKRKGKEPQMVLLKKPGEPILVEVEASLIWQAMEEI